jgi:uncharacterized integral membrane protein (TIGR00698 family)
MIALLIGIVVGNTGMISANFESGVSFASSKMLEVSIIFLAFAINYSNIAKIGPTSFIAVAVVLFAILFLTFVLAKKFNCPGATGWLVGFGTAICGSAAIAALAPSVTKDKEDVAVSMAVVNLYGTLGMIFLPMILLRTGMSSSDIGLMIGGSLHSVGNVAGAGFTVGPEAGEAAITIKLARVALLTPGLIFINFLINRKTAQSWKDHFKLPWYLIAFIAITILGTFVNFSASFLETMESIGKITLTVAMAAIGIKVSFKKLIQSGRKGLSFGLVLFLIQLSLLALFIQL